LKGPWNPWGDERRAPYILTDRRERRIRGRRETGVGAGSWIVYPPNEPVTMWQVEVPNKELLAHAGKGVHMPAGPVTFREAYAGRGTAAMNSRTRAGSTGLAVTPSRLSAVPTIAPAAMRNTAATFAAVTPLPA
jgi:hypothetical protein